MVVASFMINYFSEPIVVVVASSLCSSAGTFIQYSSTRRTVISAQVLETHACSQACNNAPPLCGRLPGLLVVSPHGHVKHWGSAALERILQETVARSPDAARVERPGVGHHDGYGCQQLLVPKA